MSLAAAPAAPGSYALHLRLAQPLTGLAVGRLGIFDFLPGDYIYLGSARGPGGLRARLAHHARSANRPHWHVDTLRRHAQLVGAWTAQGEQPLECAWSQALSSLPGATLPAPGFGAADCRRGCLAHLVCCSPDMAVPVLELTTSSLRWFAL